MPQNIRYYKHVNGIDLEQLPEKYIPYREKIKTLRSYGLGIAQKTVYEEIVEWLKAHDGKMPRITIGRNKKEGSRKLTTEERIERNLADRWYRSSVFKAFKVCASFQIEELPSEYEQYKEQIAVLRTYQQTEKNLTRQTRNKNNLKRNVIQKKPERIRQKRTNQTAYEGLIEWMKTHNGKMPRGLIKRNGKTLSINEMTEREKEEVSLKRHWIKTPEYIALQACVGISTEELPLKYQQYKEQIICLRNYGLGLSKRKTYYEKLIEWLETHDGKMPRGTIKRNGKLVAAKELTDEERKERSIKSNWSRAPEYEALQACIRNSLRGTPSKISTI